MIKLVFIVWFIFMLSVSFIPLAMMKRKVHMTGRDLFFVLIGMLVMGGFSLIAILS